MAASATTSISVNHVPGDKREVIANLTTSGTYAVVTFSGTRPTGGGVSITPASVGLQRIDRVEGLANHNATGVFDVLPAGIDSSGNARVALYDPTTGAEVVATTSVPGVITVRVLGV